MKTPADVRHTARIVIATISSASTVINGQFGCFLVVGVVGGLGVVVTVVVVLVTELGGRPGFSCRLICRCISMLKSLCSFAPCGAEWSKPFPVTASMPPATLAP